MTKSKFGLSIIMVVIIVFNTFKIANKNKFKLMKRLQCTMKIITATVSIGHFFGI